MPGLKDKEIERKFIIESLPQNLDKYPRHEILQGYLAIIEDGTEVRIRQKGQKHYLTVKSGGRLQRDEVEIELTHDQFTRLWPLTIGKRIEKVRYELEHAGNLIELDVYRSSLKGLVTAEVEFQSMEDSESFVPPEWFGREVTQDERYKNKSLAVSGLPNDSSPS